VNDGRGVGVRTDVYLVGATLYRIVMGRPPHEADSYDATLISIWTSQPAFSRDVAPPLRAIIETAMHAEPERRYESVDALRLALYQYLRHRASMRLVDQVERQLEELRALIDEGAGATKQLYQHFGECRFGLREALRGWSDNAHAKRLLCELLDQMIDHLLDNDDPGGAAALLAEHPDASAQLSDRVEQALALQQRRREDLERLEAELDPRLGRGARRAAMVAMGVAWTAAPMLANHIDPSALPRSFNYASPVVLLLVALAVWYRARASLAKTAINRRFLVAMLVGFCAHMIHVLVVQLGGLPLKTELAMGMVSFGAIAAVLAYTAERRLWPVVPIYWAGAIAAGLWRDHSAYVLSFANLVLTLYMLAIWSPQRVAAATDPSSAR
jgi:hypothetical protein